MPIRIITEVRICADCHHSVAVCTCHAVEQKPVFVNKEIPDWTEERRVQLQQQRDRINNMRQNYAAQTTALMRKRKEENEMPVHVIAETERQSRRVMTGKFAAIPEVVELWASLRSLPQGKAIQVDLPKATIESIKHDNVEFPVRAIVGAVRRKMAVEELPFEVYGNPDETSFTVMRRAAGAVPRTRTPHKAGKK